MPGAITFAKKDDTTKRANLMHRAFLLLIPAAAAFAASGCIRSGASGAPYSQNESYAGFDTVDVSAGVEVVLAQGNFAVKAESINGASLDKLIVEVRGKTLHVSRKETMLGWGGGPRYRVNVSAPAFSAFEASSGSSLEGAGLQLADLDVDVSSGAKVNISGACKTLRVEIASGASFDGEGLKCETANVDASSGAHAEAFAARSADGNASSGANVTFHGNPAILEKDSSSGGSVSAR